MAEHNYCPVHAAIELLQEKWNLHIIRELLKGSSGFNELGRAVGGVNSNTLAQRLEHLEQLGLVTKTIISTMPPRTSYELTCAGFELQEVIDAIQRWGLKHLKQEVQV
ncbi:MAG: helix-turn-helix transcriptional regulator [Trueperaceae bacterium]|nr:helix-turn-helix transcriptional regulator [Trueperaceae bacterium]